MDQRSMSLVRLVGLSLLTACAGCGGGDAADADAPTPSVASGRTAGAAPAAARDRTAGNVLSPAGAIPKGAPAPAAQAGAVLDQLVANRVHAELDRIEQLLRRGAETHLEQREALEVVGDARAELQKDRPNKLRLRSLLAGLAEGVQVLDGLTAPGEFLGRLVPMI
jgi:hypothetical protein